ncbi:MAG: 50S ribosomal protein L11 methyltransferase [Bacteroidota bacterium]|nr:50S ribosomal protein L11 methyltransferase [Bacteroidota bacterium]
MALSQYFSLSFNVSLEYEENLKGYFLMNYDVQGFEESSTGLLTVYLLRSDWNESEMLKLKEYLADLPKKEISFTESEEIEDKDWNAAWEAEIEPIQISKDLVITPSWKLDEAKSLPHTYLLVIDPKMSFGTGHHETTRLCLAAIESLECRSKSILDIGTGTGALAMYALLRGASNAVGIDTDEWSYKNVIENRERNGFSNEQFDVRHGDLASTVKPPEHFEIILANIHRNILLAIAGEIKSHHTNGGDLVLSGILEYDAEEVLDVYNAEGYSLVNRMQENEWIALHLKLQSE